MRQYPFAKRKLFAPGPVSLPPFVQEVFQQYQCHHRSPEFQEVLLRVFDQLKKVFQTENHCYLLASTGTGAMEAAVVNSLRQSDRLLSIASGKFGQRWAKVAQSFGIPVDQWQVPWGEDLDLNQLEEKIKNGKSNKSKIERTINMKSHI